MLSVYHVKGDSMSSQIKNGEYIVVFTWILFMPWPGLNVVYHHPDYGVILKSIVNVNRKKKTFSSQGLSSLSVDAENLKSTPIANIKGFVIWQPYHQQCRRGF
jgi:hypothetical protein